MNNEQVAHLWANKSRTSAKGSSFYFDGDTIYSYGSHFPIARHYKGVILFTTRGYSTSTSKHIGYARSASHHLTTFYTNDPQRDPSKRDLKGYKERIADKALAAVRARSNKEWALNALNAEVAKANKFAAHFGFKTKFTVPSSIDLDALKAEAAASAAREHKATAAKKAKAEKDAAETISKWLAGERVTIPNSVSKVYLRYAAPFVEQTKTPMLQTSKGAEVLLAEAEKAFRFIMLKRESGWHRNGETFKVGDFQLDEVTADYVKAGCHKIEFCEIERFAKAQGWL